MYLYLSFSVNYKKRKNKIIKNLKIRSNKIACKMSEAICKTCQEIKEEVYRMDNPLKIDRVIIMLLREEDRSSAMTRHRPIIINLDRKIREC